MSVQHFPLQVQTNLISPPAGGGGSWKDSSTQGPVAWHLNVGQEAGLLIWDYILICGRQTNQSELQLYLYRLNPTLWSRLKIDPLLLKAELLLWDNKCAHTGGSWLFLSSKGFVWSITIILSCGSKWYALLRQKLFYCWQIENDESHIMYVPCDDHFVGPLLWGEKCSPLFWRVGESLPSFLSLSVRLRLKTSAKSCRESSVGGGAGGGGSSAYDRSTVINKLQAEILL